MQVLLVPSATSPRERRRQFATSYVVNGTVAIDAGCLGFYGNPAQQARVRHVFLTHSHLDHVASLPTFLDNAFTGDDDCVTIHGTEPVLDSLRRDIFNNRVWPDLFEITANGRPYLKTRVVQPGRVIRVNGLSITAVEVHHVVPTVGYIIEDEGAAIVIPSDTGATEAIWQRARKAPNLKAVFLEATFPNAMDWLATLAKHLTPRLFASEVAKLPPSARLIAVHIHPRYYGQIAKELKALGLDNLELARPGKTYRF